MSNSEDVSVAADVADQCQWLRDVAKTIVLRTFVAPEPTHPSDEEDDVYAYHRLLLHMGFLYANLRHSIRFNKSEDIIRMWRYWLIPLLGGGRSNYSNEAANLLANLAADWPEDLVQVFTYNRTVNMTGKVGHNKPIDQLVEHYNL